MKATISLDAIYDFLKSLALSKENERWLAEKLLQDADEGEETTLCPYTVKELQERIKQSEEDFKEGRFLTGEEADREMEQLLTTL